MKYPYFKLGSSTVCVYCGETPETMDHVIPVSYQTIIDKPKDRMTDFGPVVHCCHHCNSILGDRYFDTFEARCQKVNHYMTDRLRPVIWTKTEIKALDVSLQRYVEQDQARRKWMFNRADWFQGRDYYLNLEGLLWQSCLDYTSNSFHKELHRFFAPTLIWVRGLYR